ncbi:hypothetical protein BpHYR1_038015 [Brachionus plicatilis]|uniref:Uncharacterized protein n=1 Tax=Brachionus plicatilis TaxID=10195 RepID=A0A3M7QQB8_BRAPC|nr:hypothetical protein BpHYR1_038015 [Brachionus plicatilis]
MLMVWRFLLAKKITPDSAMKVCLKFNCIMGKITYKIKLKYDKKITYYYIKLGNLTKLYELLSEKNQLKI